MVGAPGVERTRPPLNQSPSLHKEHHLAPPLATPLKSISGDKIRWESNHLQNIIQCHKCLYILKVLSIFQTQPVVWAPPDCECRPGRASPAGGNVEGNQNAVFYRNPDPWNCHWAFSCLAQVDINRQTANQPKCGHRHLSPCIRLKANIFFSWLLKLKKFDRCDDMR